MGETVRGGGKSGNGRGHHGIRLSLKSLGELIDRVVSEGSTGEGIGYDELLARYVLNSVGIPE